MRLLLFWFRVDPTLWDMHVVARGIPRDWGAESGVRHGAHSAPGTPPATPDTRAFPLLFRRRFLGGRGKKGS